MMSVDVIEALFFKSIHETFIHILRADQNWLWLFSSVSTANNLAVFEGVVPEDWEAFQEQRTYTDEYTLEWASHMTELDVKGDIRWTPAMLKVEVSRPKTLLYMHFFNHQTHHRGQIHAMLTAADIVPGDTDLGLMPI